MAAVARRGEEAGRQQSRQTSQRCVLQPNSSSPLPQPTTLGKHLHVLSLSTALCKVGSTQATTTEGWCEDRVKRRR